MRIGLLTLPLETGYGSILQAYALKNTYSENLPAFSTTRKSTTNTP